MDVDNNVEDNRSTKKTYVYDLSSDASEDLNYVDLSNAGLYVLALQVLLVTVFVSIVSSAISMICGLWAASAIRNLAVTTVIAICGHWSPIRCGRVAGLYNVFWALRPCVFMYVASLISGQLVHSCFALNDDNSSSSIVSFWEGRSVLYNLITLPLIFSGIWRARNPISNRDFPVLVVVINLFVVSVMPLPGIRGSGPLCSMVDTWQLVERAARAFSLAITYSAHVFSCSPDELDRGMVYHCALRASAATTWILVVHRYFICLFVVQLFVLIKARLNLNEPQMENCIQTASRTCCKDNDSVDSEVALLESEQQKNGHIEMQFKQQNERHTYTKTMFGDIKLDDNLLQQIRTSQQEIMLEPDDNIEAPPIGLVEEVQKQQKRGNFEAISQSI